MNNSNHGVIAVALMTAIVLSSSNLMADTATPVVAANKDKATPVVALKAEAFSLQDVRLLDGPFHHAMELDRAYLLSLDPDRLLHDFRLNAGLPATAKSYGGWMNANNVAGCGQFVGHYLSACALMYASTGDERLKENANRVVAGFGQCQAKMGTGYLQTKPDNFSTRGEAPLGLWYNIHKYLAGLFDMYVYCDNPQALEIARKLGDWAKAASDKLSDRQIQNMLGLEHGGINEAFANLYALTGDEKYLKLAIRFNHMAIIGPASKREDDLTKKHANTQVPKFVGTAREYELTGDDSLKTASTFFWDTVVKERSYVIGGNSIGEFFSAKEKLSQAVAPNTCETCNTYNMLKLTRHLFSWDPRAEYADYYERALYNHILASQDPVTGMMCYFLPLASGPKKYCSRENDFWCCTGTGIENHAKYGDSIYFHRGAAELFVNLFIASELNWRSAGVVLRQETKYPDEGRTRLVFTCDKPVDLRINIRHPWWATSGFEIQVNGVGQHNDSQLGSYAIVTRKWKSGDTVDIVMPMSLRTEGFRDNPRRVALMYGPLVLCAATNVVLYAATNVAMVPCPAFMAEESRLFAGFKPVPDKPCTFTASSQVLRLGEGTNDHCVTVEPLFRVHGNRAYNVYWDVVTPAQWQADEQQRKVLQARTVDQVIPFDKKGEQNHNILGEKTSTGENVWRPPIDGSGFACRIFGGATCAGWRQADDGGWFSWDLKALPSQPQELRVKYWGGDNGGREFDILVDGEKLATQKLDNNKPNEFCEETYLLPDAVMQGKEKVTIKFQAHPGKKAGGVFGCVILTSGK